ncbi:hypothetical protein PITCH_A2410002 [uncultured Desulfobacterium sp.]|uniref:HTH araC/xylS-type domain-containing protein n=1 Tax=uncultured Desulfobacterium sp. TaxID=201089 RepID=A0A445MYG1_9BACT|nr:hypothetical protein PITCH_A2410002 [uncultured Desulfobacterium sp.]
MYPPHIPPHSTIRHLICQYIVYFRFVAHTQISQCAKEQNFAKKEVTLTYLNEDDVTICDVAFLLGFSEQSPFSPAFKIWTGGTPKYYFKKTRR